MRQGIGTGKGKSEARLRGADRRDRIRLRIVYLVPRRDLAFAHQHRGAADDVRGLGEGVEPPAEVGPAVLRLRARSDRGEEKSEIEEGAAESLPDQRE